MVRYFKPAAFCLIILISACRNGGNEASAKRFNSFLAGWARTDTIPVPTLKKYTLLGAVDYWNSNQFKLDSVCYAGSKYPFIIISFKKNGACRFRYLLVFNAATLKNTAFKPVQMDCKSDGRDAISEINFKPVDETHFCIQDIYFKWTADEHVRQVAGQHCLKIDEKGLIVNDN